MTKQSISKTKPIKKKKSIKQYCEARIKESGIKNGYYQNILKNDVTMKKKKQPRFPDYEIVDLDKEAGEKVVTFGTTLFMRKDKQALRICFPTGQIVTFCPQENL